MKVVKSNYVIFNNLALQLAEIVGVMLICGLILGFVGKFIFGKRAVGLFSGIGALGGIYVAFKIGML